MSPEEALKAAVKAAGSQTALARICGCTQGAISQMLAAKPPRLSPQYVRKVEASLGIPSEVLRPDIFGEVERARGQLALSARADFYPGLREGESCDDYDGASIEWTFALPRNALPAPGVYRIEFVRTLAEEARLGNPTFGTGQRRSAEDSR